MKQGIVDTIEGDYYTVWFEDTKRRTPKIKKLDHVETLSISDIVVVGFFGASDGVIIGKLT